MQKEVKKNELSGREIVVSMFLGILVSCAIRLLKISKSNANRNSRFKGNAFGVPGHQASDHTVHIEEPQRTTLSDRPECAEVFEERNRTAIAADERDQNRATAHKRREAVPRIPIHK